MNFKCNKSLDLINSVDASIQFTSEVENNNYIAFLGLDLIKLHTGHLKFKIHRKQTHTDKYLSFDSYNLNNHKESVVRTLLDN